MPKGERDRDRRLKTQGRSGKVKRGGAGGWIWISDSKRRGGCDGESGVEGGKGD